MENGGIVGTGNEKCQIYLRIPNQQGGVVRLVPDPYLRYMATQDPAEQAAREAALATSGDDLHTALCHLAHDDLQKNDAIPA